MRRRCRSRAIVGRRGHGRRGRASALLLSVQLAQELRARVQALCRLLGKARDGALQLREGRAELVVLGAQGGARKIPSDAVLGALKAQLPPLQLWFRKQPLVRCRRCSCSRIGGRRNAQREERRELTIVCVAQEPNLQRVRQLGRVDAHAVRAAEEHAARTAAARRGHPCSGRCAAAARRRARRREMRAEVLAVEIVRFLPAQLVELHVSQRRREQGSRGAPEREHDRHLPRKRRGSTVEESAFEGGCVCEYRASK